MKDYKVPFSRFFIAFLFPMIPLGLLAAFLALAGYDVSMVNDEYVHGFAGFFYGIVTIPISALIMTIITWPFYTLGNYMYRWFMKHVMQKKQEEDDLLKDFLR
ncbi:hypothetical protein LX64_01837 [Chitinophaga skermanii]|uniref:Uncharacterized protein n=1 Tax=Chitinophaga skermanii TaxID=331697 RepID=A0A327QQV3_9BACT|nr:hypothetical protein [Chitinophaga skermanii]RAJ06710.1 hypothetical protein LX64_01837 [Chitinophaga skermanii]